MVDQEVIKTNLTNFEIKVLDFAKNIPKGKITSYKELARAIGRSKSYRAVGNVLHKNSHALKIPCHRIVKNDGKIGGFVKEIEKKIVLLKEEGIRLENNKIKDFNKVFFKF